MCEEHKGIVTLTLNRPKQYNALSEEMLAALQTAFDDLTRDEPARVVVIAANGKAVFYKQLEMPLSEAYSPY